jgi:hypothetical protein
MFYVLYSVNYWNTFYTNSMVAKILNASQTLPMVFQFDISHKYGVLPYDSAEQDFALMVLIQEECIPDNIIGCINTILSHHVQFEFQILFYNIYKYSYG